MPSKKKVAIATEAALLQFPLDRLDRVVTGSLTPEAAESVVRDFNNLLTTL